MSFRISGLKFADFAALIAMPEDKRKSPTFTCTTPAPAATPHASIAPEAVLVPEVGVEPTRF